MKNKFFYIWMSVCLLGVYAHTSQAEAAETTVASQVVQWQIDGVDAAMEKNIRAQLKASALKSLENQPIQEASLQADIRTALAPLGYFNPQIQWQTVRSEKGQVFKCHIVLGEPIRIRTLIIQVEGMGAQNRVLQKTKHKLPLKIDQIFSAADYEEAKKKLFKAALSQGYFEAHWIQTNLRIDPRPQKNRADIQLILNTGPRYQFGEILFEDATYDAAFLKRFAPFAYGENYTDQKLQYFQQVLSSADYFKSVFVQPLIGSDHDNAHAHAHANKTVPIKVSLKPLPLKQYKLGLGYGTDTGIRALIGMEWRRVNAEGEQFKAQTQISQIETALNMDYIIPGQQPATDQYVISAKTGQQNQDLGEGQLAKLAGSRVTEIAGWKQIISLTLQHEWSTLESNAEQSQTLLYPTVTWSKVVQNNVLKPSRGYNMQLQLLAVPQLFDNTPFLQIQTAFKTIHPVFKKDRFLLRGQFSYIHINKIEDLPLSFQFFAGGAQSVRGYHYNTLGPGATAVVGSAEYRHNILKDIYFVTFIDAGRVSSGLNGPFKKGIGVGVVWQSVLGTLELTMTQAQDLPNKPWALQFKMGGDL